VTLLGLRAEDILFGRGGDHAGVEAHGAVSGERVKILSLAAGKAVYAMDVSTDGEAAVAGTSAGGVYAITRHEDGNARYQARQIGNGAPVLSMSFVDSSIVAVADTAGRCILRQSRGNVHVKELPTGGRVICALFRLDRRHLAGLAVTGELLVWDWSKYDLVQLVDVPMPPEDLAALIKPVYWPDADFWVWPGRRGAIVSYNWQRNEIRAVCHHTAKIYAMVICKGQLLTFGRDGCTSVWCVGASEPAGTREAPREVISAASWVEEETAKVLLINDSGEAGIYLWTDSGLALDRLLVGGDYRTVVGPDLERFELAVRQQKMSRARELTGKISETIAIQRWDDSTEAGCEELESLGFRPAVLALRGQAARSENNLVGELNFYDQMASIIPHEQAGSEISLARYAGLLESVWQLEKARALYLELSERYPHSSCYRESIQRLTERISIVKTGRYVIGTDVPIVSLVKSAMLLGEQLAGRYLVKSRDRVSCKAVISADEFVKKYERLCDGNPQMPRARTEDLWWLSEDKSERVSTVVIGNEDRGNPNHLEVGIKFFDAQLQTVLVPVIMLNTRDHKKNISQEQRNQAILKGLQLFEDDCFKGWLEMVEQTINQAVCQLISRAKGQGRIRSME